MTHLKWTELLKRKLLGQALSTVERDGKFYVLYDSVTLERVGNKFHVSLSVKGEQLFAYDSMNLEDGCSLTLLGLGGQQEIKLDS